MFLSKGCVSLQFPPKPLAHSIPWRVVASNLMSAYMAPSSLRHPSFRGLALVARNAVPTDNTSVTVRTALAVVLLAFQKDSIMSPILPVFFWLHAVGLAVPVDAPLSGNNDENSASAAISDVATG